MYENFFKFREKPFSLTPDPKFLYLSKQHQGALDHMLYGINQREGFLSVTGDVGTGKTTLCRCLLERLDENVAVALVLNPMVSDMDLLRTCVHDLGVKPVANWGKRPAMADSQQVEVSIDPNSLAVPIEEELWVNQASKKELIDALNSFLLEKHAEGGTTVLIIDEAQNLPLEVMEQLRLLSNLETEKEKLLQILFVGQLELNAKLQRPELKQLNQRISIRYEIAPLSRPETINYINHRIQVAGGGSRVAFTQAAYNEAFQYSRGYPRLINLVCDRALLAGYNAQVDTIERAHVKQGIKSLLGDEEKPFFADRHPWMRLPVMASVAFCAAGLCFFAFAQMGFNWEVGSRNLGDTIKMALGISADRAALPKSGSRFENDGAGKETGNFLIQVFSLKNDVRAREEVRKLKREGYNAYWKKTVSRRENWYIVLIGPFDEIKSARIHLDALKFSGRKPILLSGSNSG